MRQFHACLAFATIVAASAALTSQSIQPEPFHTGIDLVRLDVSVLDKNRQPVRGLRAEDFTVLEDGKPQPVVAFSAVDIPPAPPVGAEWMRDIGADVATNQLDLRRIVVILMDDGMSSPDDGVPTAARRIARGVIDRLGPNDLAAVVFTLWGKAQNFTTDRRQLTAAIDSFAPRAIQAPAKWSAASPGNRGISIGGPPLACLMPGGGGNCLTRTLKSVATALEDTPVGRKTIVLISSGVPYDFTMENLDAGDEMNDLRRTFTSLQRANVNVYPFDPRGLTNEGIIGATLDSLRMFAENTGGRATVATNTPWEHVEQVFLENGSYYLLGVRPSVEKTGGFRRITVKVARPGAEVRTRAGYFAAAARSRGRAPVAQVPPTGLDKAFGAALPSGTLPIDVSVAPLAGSDGKQPVVIVTTGIRRFITDTTATQKFEIRTAAFDPSTIQQRAAQRQTVEVTLRPNAGGERRFEFHSRLALRPGRYEIRSAAGAPGSTGGVFTNVEVPDFSKAALSLSGLVIGFARNANQDGLADLLPIVPTVSRVFPRSAQVAAFVRVYQGGKDALAPVQMRLRVLDAGNRAAVDDTMTLAPARFGASRAADCPFQLPLSRLTPGEYLLTIEASAGKTARRDVRFRVTGDQASRP
jgi:VWFA-related protein